LAELSPDIRWNLLSWHGDFLILASKNKLRFYYENDGIEMKEIELEEMENITIVKVPVLGSRIIIVAGLSKVCLYWLNIDKMVIES
jgi:hypothetical protein